MSIDAAHITNGLPGRQQRSKMQFALASGLRLRDRKPFVKYL